MAVERRVTGDETAVNVRALGLYSLRVGDVAPLASSRDKHLTIEQPHRRVVYARRGHRSGGGKCAGARAKQLSGEENRPAGDIGDPAGDQNLAVGEKSCGLKSAGRGHQASGRGEGARRGIVQLRGAGVLLPATRT